MSSSTTIPSAPSTTAAGTSGRGRGNHRGRGRGRGRGTGRGYRGGHRGGQPPRQPGDNALEESSNAPQDRRTPKAPLTHFLALPLGHHAGLRDRLSAFTRSLLDSLPPIPGLDESIVISPRRLHITLGVMSLTDATTNLAASASSTESAGVSSESPPQTVESALALLNQLKPKILEMLDGERLRVALEYVDIMRPDRGDLEKAHVMWIGPPREGDDAQRLKRISGFVNKEFKKAGLVVDEKRPLKLHCTMLNTVYRRGRGGRVPFSYAALLSSTAFRSIERPEAVETTDETPRGKKPIQVDFGEWTIDEIQVCKMGSWGPEGEYVSVGHITLD